MTFDELELLVATADRAGLVKAVRGMPESERKKLSKATAKLHRDMQNSKWEPPKAAKNNGLLTRLTLGIRERQRRIQDQFTVARLATLAFCSLSTVRNVHAGYNGSEDMKAMMDILADRRPEWINEWLNAKIGSEWSEINWDTTRALVTSGLCDRPTSGGYIGLMIRGLPDPSYAKEGRRHTPLSRKLLKAPDLLDDEVWRLFEIETYAFFNLHSYERSPHAVEGFENWGQALCRLADEGHLDRGRLMDSSLSGLTMGFSNNMLTGYIAFHDRLKPSIDELTERQQTYIDLLPCSASRVVTFALKMLKALDKAKLLDDAAFLATSQCLLNIPTKTQPKTGLMLLKHIVKRNADMAPLAARAAATGLTHPSPDIQERALELLELAAVEDDEKLHAIIANCLEDLAAVHRPRAEQLLSKLGDMSPSEQLDAVTPKTDLMRTELIQRCEALSGNVRKLAGIDNAISALDTQSLPDPLTFAITDVPILTSLTPIQPIESFDELLDAVSHAVEVVDSADEVERILDGISRLCDQRPDNFDQLVAPLVKRICTDSFSETSRGLVHSLNSPRRIKELLLTWLKKIIPLPKITDWNLWAEPTAVMSARIAELAKRIYHQQAAPLLAAPTHERGWIDPRVLCQRLIDIQNADLVFLQRDTIQALLRMAPDHRNEALIAAGQIEGDMGRIVRWALGGDEKIKRRDRKQSLLWLAAGRARDPFGHLDALAKSGVADLGPDAISPAVYSWSTSVKEQVQRYSKKVLKIPTLSMVIKPKSKINAKRAAFPTTSLHTRAKINRWMGQRDVYHAARQWLADLIAMNWPVNCNGFFAAGACSMIKRINDPGSTFTPNFAFLSPLFEPDRPVTEMGALAICTGLVGRDADARAQAIDVLTETIQDGRVHGPALGDILVKLSDGGWIKLNRLADALGDVARLSAIHTHVVTTILQHWLAAQKQLPRDAHHILTLLVDLMSRLGLTLAGNAHGVLNSVKGASKTAKLARKLLTHTPEAPTPMLAEAMLQHLEARISRAERWQVEYRPTVKEPTHDA